MNGLQRFIQEIHRRSLWQVLGIYLIGGWIALQVVQTLTETLGLPEWFPPFAVVLLIIGLPIVLATAFVQKGLAPSKPAEVSEPTEPAAARTGGPGQLFTWRNAIGGGVLAFALWGVVAAAWIIFGWGFVGGGDRSSIAVLPFSNQGGEESAYFADGIHDDILTQLSKIGSLRVISRTSVLEYKDTRKNIRDIGRELGVATILEGSVRYDPENKRVRVVAQLIDAGTDRHLWADQYDRDLSDVFAIQSELALNIAKALRATLSPEEERRIEKARTDNLAAYDLLLRGRELYGRSQEENEKAIEYFREATRVAPDYAEAWAWLANGYGQSVQIGGRGHEWADSGIAAARRAIELDPELPEAHKALGLNLDQTGQLTAGAEPYRRALELNPNYATPMINLSSTEFWLGRCDEGMQLAERARALSPRYQFPPMHLAVHNWCLGRDEEFRRWIEITRSIDPEFLWIPVAEAFFHLSRGDYAAVDSLADVILARDRDSPFGLFYAAEARLYRGDFVEAEQRYERLLQRAPDWGYQAMSADARSGLALARSRQGKSEGVDSLIADGIRRVQATLDRGADDPDYWRALAALLAVRGERDEALIWLERAQEGLVNFRTLALNPRFEGIRGDPRFRAVLERIEERVAAMRARVEERERGSRPAS